MNNLLAQFYSALHELSLTPEAPEARTSAIESAISLADTLNFVVDEFNTMHNDLNERVSLMVEDVNRMAYEIASLNQSIAVAEVSGKAHANDLRDQRDALLSEMSEVIPIRTIEDEEGKISVTLAGQRLVDGISVNPLTTVTIQNSNGLDTYQRSAR